MNRRYACLAPAAIVCLAYLNSFWGVFQFDDYNVIVNYEVVHSWSAWVHNIPSGIRPVLKLTYLANWTSGLGLFGFHLLNLLIHVTNTAFVYFLSRRVFKSIIPSVLPALFAALLFAVHPVQTEAVSYISGRSTSLMATFYLGSMLAYIRGSDKKENLWNRWISPVLFILALLTKETALTLPGALLLWELAFGLDRRFTAILRKQIMHWVLFATASFSLIAHPGYGGMLEYSFDIRGIKESLLSQVSGVFYLLSKLILPFSLNIDPDLPVLSKWTPLLAIKAGILSALFCTGLIRFRRVPVVGFGILWFFLVLLPTNSFVPRLDVANERQLYFSSWGLFAVVSAAAARVQARARSNFIYWIIIAILAALFCSTLLRNHVYRSEISLWEDTVRKSPRKPRAYNNLGYAYAISGRYAEAKKAYRQALNLNPDYEPALANLRALPKNVQ